MATVIVMCIAMIWGVIYLIAQAVSGAVNSVAKQPKKQMSEEDTKLLSIILLDAFIFVIFTVTAGTAGLVGSILICLIMDIVIADGLNKTSSNTAVRRANQQTAKEDKEHNDWGYINWEEVDE